MKIKVSSDWHCEFRSLGDINGMLENVLNGGNWDVLILAGDIANKWLLEPVLGQVSQWCGERNKVCFFVPGNHEFYGRLSAKYPCYARQVVSETFNLTTPHLITLNRSVFTHKGVNFAGCVGWHLQKDDCNPVEADCIKPFREAEGEKDLEFLTDVVDNDRADVIITHYLPSRRSVHARYVNSGDNRFFFTSYLEPLLERTKAKLWVHGHTHDKCDYPESGTRVMCYPAGYPKEDGNAHAKTYGKTAKI